MAETSDKELLSTLTNTNTTLTGQLAAEDKVIAALRTQLRSNINAPSPAPGNDQVSAPDKNK
jgi:hypothetical protein